MKLSQAIVAAVMCATAAWAQTKQRAKTGAAAQAEISSSSLNVSRADLEKHGIEADWRMYNGDYTGRRYSSLTQVTRENAHTLVPQWVFHSRNAGILEVTPVVFSGVMYVTGSNDAYALDATTGKTLWHHTRPVTQGLIDDASGHINRGVAVLGKHHRILCTSFAAPREPPGMPRSIVRRAGKLSQHLPQKHLQVAMNRQIRLDGRLLQFGRIHVHLDLEGFAREGCPVIAHLPDVQARAQDQEYAGVLYREVARAFADGAGASAEQCVIGRDQVVRPGSSHRDTEFADHPLEFIHRAGGPNTGAGHDHGPDGFAKAI